VSVEKVVGKDGQVVWRVRWRQGQRNRSKVLGRKRDAEAFDAELRRRRRLGELGLMDAGNQKLADFGQEWWQLYAEPNLSRATLRLYAMLWDTHILPRLGDLKLRELTVETLQRYRLDLQAAGVGLGSIRKALVLLHGILQRAVEWNRLAANPMLAVKKPPAGRARLVQPLPPESVEAMRRLLLGQGLLRDATLISVLAYAGLRPGEALGLNWGSVQERTLLIERAVSMGEIGPTKTRRARTVRLLKPLARDLAEWRLRSGRPPDADLVFPGHDGGPWTLTAYQNWRRRFFDRATKACGIEGARPYDLRHSFVSLLIHEGRNVVDVARQAGHAPTMALNTYAHVFEEFDPAERLSAEERIERARGHDSDLADGQLVLVAE
jgi:integrase